MHHSPKLAIVFVLLGCGGVAPVQTPRLPEGNYLPGFDTRVYPGAAAMEAWRKNSPYAWVGYYLPAPCYTGRTWIGKRAELHAQGWGTAVLFVGEQDWRAMGRTDTAGVATQNPRCTAANLTAANGTLHAQVADSTASAEGFDKNTIIFLDVERVDSVSAALADYVRAWAAQLLAGAQYTPGLYAHERNAAALHAVMIEQFSAARRNTRPALWVAKSSPLFTLSSRPSESGLVDASIWQGLHNREGVWGGVTLRIDSNVAATEGPGMLTAR